MTKHCARNIRAGRDAAGDRHRAGVLLQEVGARAVIVAEDEDDVAALSVEIGNRQE